MKRRITARSAALLALFVSFTSTASSSSPVKVSLRTSWTETPIFLEAIEAIAVEDPNAFFPLINSLTDPEVAPHTAQLTAEAIHQRTLQTAVTLGFLDEPGALESARLQLALHATSPKIQAFYQFYDDEHFPHVEDCESWVDWYGERICDVETLARLAGHDTINSLNGTDRLYLRPKLLPFDHVHPSPVKTLVPPPRTAILYASPSSRNFRELHTFLYKLSTSSPQRLEYVLRYAPPTYRNKEKTYLAGYGVSLDLKKTDYLAVDDRNTGKKDRSVQDGLQSDSAARDDIIYELLSTFSEKEIEENGDGAPEKSTGLTEQELRTIGIEVTHLVSSSPNPLQTLSQLVQNFPKYAKAVAQRVTVSNDVEVEVRNNGLLVQGGVSAIWFNGGSAPISDITALSLLRLLRRERATVLSLTKLGLTPSQAVGLLTHPTIAESQNQEGPKGLDGFVDASDRPEGGELVVWWNDFVNDEKYERWPSGITGLLQPLYPGQMPSVRLNIFNIVLVLDLSQTTSLNLLAGTLNTVINRGIPLRFGIVPSVESVEAQRMARLISYLVKYFDKTKTMGFISRISQMHTPPHLMTPLVDWDLVRTEFVTLLHNYPPEEEDTPTDLDAILDGSAPSQEEWLEKARRYALRLDAMKDSCPTGHAFVNGKHIDIDDEFLKYTQVEVSSQMQHLQEKIYSGELDDTTAETIDTYFYDLPGTTGRRNRYVYPAPFTAGLPLFNIPEIFSRLDVKYGAGAFLYPETEAVPMTTYIIADLDSVKGMQLASSAVSALKSKSSSRLSFIHNPISMDAIEQQPTHRHISPIISYLVKNELLSKISVDDFEEHLNAHSDIPDATASQAILSGNSAVYQLLKDAGYAIETLAESPVYEEYCTKGLLLSKEFGIKPGDAAILINGRVVGPIDPAFFTVEGFGLLEEYEMRKRGAPVMSALANMTVLPEQFNKTAYSELISMASSVVASVLVPDPSEKGLFNTAPRPRQRTYQQLARNFTGFEIGDSSKAIFHFGILLDPLSDVAQKWSSVLQWLATLPSVYVEVYLNPAPYVEVPLKRYYRYNLPSALAFDEDGKEVHSETTFEGLPMEPIYTLAMDVPQSWLVRPREALGDLDNIQLSNNPDGVDAIFELDYLVIEGHARDALTNHPPRGLQLQLSSIDGAPIDDTQVVANLGYLQFKAKPGVFQLEIREGRGRDVYAMESVGNEGWNSPNVSEVGIEVTLTSFEGLTLYPRVRRQRGMERADVLDEFVVVDAQPKGFFDHVASRVASFFRSGDTQKAIAPRQADINIFTVASGLLYERFASIMILSVLKNTKSSVKFWFIENFLSPSFLEFIPHFAQAYGFEYELVTYKWPSWLRAQKEKQRIIWAYKILFLDVLFPMDLRKVIFVDADQIVRTDLKELVNLDLHGAPYAYTPMGDDNIEMEGFRFWKQGYWKDFLKGRPYHISALYVVDLARFRQIAAGDILRQHYQQLSADPNSLANLDQDLPNNLQREVPIFSLPEDWLWCETWCSKDRLDRAKTIDLCQNPLTKEPKLSRARQIPEWEAYDSEIAQFARRLADEGVIRSHMAAADANALASASANANAAEGSAGGDGDDAGAGAGGKEADSSVEGSEAEVEDEGRGKVHAKDEL